VPLSLDEKGQHDVLKSLEGAGGIAQQNAEGMRNIAIARIISVYCF